MGTWIITDDEGAQIAGPFQTEEAARAEADRLISDDEAAAGAQVAYVAGDTMENGAEMDPNETLREIRGLIRVFDDSDADDKDTAQQVATGLATKFEALDDWLSRGGFPPEEWREGPDAVGEEPACAFCGVSLGDLNVTDGVRQYHDECWANQQRLTPEPLGGAVPMYRRTVDGQTVWSSQPEARDDDYTPEAIDRADDGQ